MSNPVIALTDQGFVERITALALTEHRTNAATLRLLVQLGLNSYDLTGSIVCPGRVRCTRPTASATTANRPRDHGTFFRSRFCDPRRGASNQRGRFSSPAPRGAGRFLPQET
jgi:hypothetical protein